MLASVSLFESNDHVVRCGLWLIVECICRITYKHGKNVSIDELVATRRESYNYGIIISDAPLCDDMFFQVLYTHIHTYTHAYTH